MNRLLALIMLALVLAPLGVALATEFRYQCQDGECREGAGCCTATRAPGVVTTSVTDPPDVLPTIHAIVVPAAPASPAPTEILHVPKSR